MSNKLGQNLAYGRNITKNPTNTISAYGDIWRYGGEKKATQQKNPACRNAYVIRGSRLYELFIGTVSHVNTEENKEWKITLELNGDSVTLKFDTWKPGQNSARPKKKVYKKIRNKSEMEKVKVKLASYGGKKYQ